MKNYLSSLPTHTDGGTILPADNTDLSTSSATKPHLSHSILRNISSLISHLSLLTPENADAFSVEFLEQENDVTLASLLGSLGVNVQAMRELGKKHAIADMVKQNMMSRKAQTAMHARMDDDVYMGRNG